jgi:hypothetical protein
MVRYVLIDNQEVDVHPTKPRCGAARTGPNYEAEYLSCSHVD